MRRRRSPSSHPGAGDAAGGDVVVAVGLLAVGLVEVLVVVGPGASLLPALGVVLWLALPLLLRRRRPGLVSLVVTSAIAVQLPVAAIRLFDQTFVGYVCLLVAAYSLGRFGRRPQFELVSAVSASLTALTIGLHDTSLVSAALAFVLVLGAAVIGRAVRARVRLRVLLAQQVAELDAAAAVAAQVAAVEIRGRIAREVQDIVSLGVREMVTRVQVARRLVATDRTAAVASIAAVEDCGRQALSEMRRMLLVLRGGENAAPDAAPTAHDDGAGLEQTWGLGQRARSADRWLVLLLVGVTVGETVVLAAQTQASTVAVTAASLVSALVATPLLVRKSLPIESSVVAWSCACALASFSTLPTAALALIGPVLAFAAGAYAGGLRGRVGLAVGWAGVGGVNLVAGQATWGDYAFPVVLVTLAWAAGRTVHEQAAMVREARDRAPALHRAREGRVAAGSAEERLRIARELHDVVAHSLMVMVVQAGAARRTLESGRDGALEALGVVEQTGNQALTELHRLLTLVDPAGGPAEPVPGIGQLEALVEHARGAGLHVELAVRGRRQPLPGGLEHAAYRVVQEALTNVLRHAEATQAWVSVDYQPDRLLLEVRDDGRGRAEVGSRPGNGIVGMRERVGIYGGELVAAPDPQHGFGVSASFRLDPVAQGLSA